MYSIKTDLGVSGNGTIDKNLQVKGDAVINGNLQVDGTVVFSDASFTQIDVTGTANLADITSTGTTSLNDVSVSGDATLGTDNTSTLTVKGKSEFDSEASFKDAVDFGDSITQTTGTASFNDTTVATLDVTGDTTLSGDLTMPTGTKATLDDLETETLKVNGNSILGGTLNVTGASTFGDITINGTIAGSFTMENGIFTTLTVAQLSTLNNVGVTGSLTLNGNLTGSNSTALLKNINLVGSDAILEFTYNDPSRPTDIKSSIEPYQISSNNFISKMIKSNSADIGVVSGDTGLHAIGKATIDYLNITGNSTIGDQNQLQVAGKSVFTGKTTVGDLEITGSVSGLTFDDITANSLNVTGASVLQGSVSIGGNLSGNAAAIASFSTFTVRDGTGGNHGIIQFAYNDSARPTDIKSSIEPYQISTNDLVTRNINADSANIGLVGGTSGLHAIGKATIDYLKIAGNSTIGTATPQLEVTGKSILGDVEFTGSVTGLTVDVSGQDLTPASVTATGAIIGQTLESVTTTTVGTNLTVGGTTTANGDVTVANNTLTVKDLVVTGTTTGVTVAVNVDGLDIKPKTVEAVDSITTPELTVSTKATIAELEVTGDATITGTLTASSIDLSSTDINAKSLTTTDDVTVEGVLRAEGTVDFSTIALGVTSITATAASTLPTLSSTNLTATNVTGTTSTFSGVSKSGTVETTTIQAAPSGAGTVTVTSDSVFNKDVTINGDLVLSGTLDLSQVDINAKSLTTTGDVTVGGTINLTNSDVVATSFVSNDNTKNNIFPKMSSDDATLTIARVTTLNTTGTSSLGVLNTTGKATLASLEVTGTTVLASTSATFYTSPTATINLNKSTVIGGDLTVTGTLTAGVIDLSTTDVTVKSLVSSGDAHIEGDLIVDGSFDLTSTNIVAASLESTGNTTVGGALVLTTGTVTGSPSISGTLNVAGATTLAAVSATSLTAPTVSATTLTAPTISGNTTFSNNVTVTGTFTPNGGLNLSGADIAAKSVTTTESVAVGTTLNVTGASTLAAVTATSVTASGVGKFGSVTADNGATVTAGNLVVTSGNISQNGASTATASFKKTSTTNLHVGTLVWDETTYIAEVGGSTHISGDLVVDGVINSAINLTGRDINPRSVTTSQNIVVGSTLTVTEQATMDSAVIGESGSLNNNLQINGNTVCTGDFTVSGRIIGTLDQSTSDLDVKSLTASTFLKGNTLEVTTTSSFGNTIHVETGGLDITGDSIFDGAINASKLSTFSGGLSTTTLTTTGLATLSSMSVTGTGTIATLVVSGTSSHTGLATFANLTSTGTITANNLTINGTLTADIANLVTQSVVTNKYLVKSKDVASATGSWTPDGTTNVYNVTLTGNITMGVLPYTAGYAGTWFIYITQDATGNHSIDWGTTYSVIGTDVAINSAANSVSICQVVYCGKGDKLDVFIAQRNL